MKVFLLILCILLALVAFLRPSIQQMHRLVSWQFPQVQHLQAEDLQDLKDSQDIVIFDVRSKEEFEQSHIENAIWISPDTDSATFESYYGSISTRKTLVFYCSLGRRSSALVNRLVQDDVFTDPLVVHNLQGGLFNWVNKGFTISGESVHPFSWYWEPVIHESR